MLRSSNRIEGPAMTVSRVLWVLLAVFASSSSQAQSTYRCGNTFSQVGPSSFRVESNSQNSRSS